MSVVVSKTGNTGHEFGLNTEYTRALFKLKLFPKMYKCQLHYSEAAYTRALFKLNVTKNIIKPLVVRLPERKLPKQVYLC